MSRPSTESLSVAAVSIPTRAEPPKELNSRQKELWRDILSTKPPEWFEDDSLPLLRAYVVAVDTHERLTPVIEEFGLDNPAVFKFLDAQDKQARLMGQLAAKMRLTQQSRYTPQSAATANKKAASGRKPWES